MLPSEGNDQDQDQPQNEPNGTCGAARLQRENQRQPFVYGRTSRKWRCAPSGQAAARAAGVAFGSSGPQVTNWVNLGPAPLASDATGNGSQDYHAVSGRATSVLVDPADTTGNTVLLGGAYGGLWKSTNAGSMSADPALR